MKIRKIIAAAALAVCLVCACLPVSASAAGYALGDNVTGVFDPDTGSLVISGSGPMYDFDTESGHVQAEYSRVVIEPGVTYVGTHFFSPNDQIDELVLPDAAITINEEAFSGSVIDRVIFPQSATDAAQYDFGDENAPFGNAVVHNLDLGGLGGFPNGFRFGYGDNYDLVSLIVGANTTAIPDNTCNCFGMLESLTLPHGLLTIGAGAFESCEMLQSVRIPDTVTTIGDYAFDYCTNLEHLHLPKDLETIGEWAFCNCEKLTSVKIPQGATTIGISAFEDCVNLSQVSVSDSVKTIGINAFNGTAVQNVHLPAGLTYIHATSFGTSLTYVCCDTEDCPAVRQFAESAEIEFRLCSGHAEAPHTPGDVNGDSVLNLKDAVLIRRYLADWDVAIDEDAADVDDDGEVTLQDVTLMNRYIAGGWNVELN